MNKWYKEVIKETETAISASLGDIKDAYVENNQATSTHLAMRMLETQVKQESRVMLQQLFRELDKEAGELESNVIRGDMEGIKGNVEGFKCTMSHVWDLVGRLA